VSEPGARSPNADTLECRLYHANNARAEPPNNKHCGHASPGGANLCVEFRGPCGDYCGIVVEACAGQDGAFADIDECGFECSQLPIGDAGEETGNTSTCRLTWANRVESDGDTSNCANALLDSPTCQ
jgi:hypothetical protein